MELVAVVVKSLHIADRSAHHEVGLAEVKQLLVQLELVVEDQLLPVLLRLYHVENYVILVTVVRFS